MNARLLSVHVGRIRTHGTPGASDPMERQWTTAYYKDPVAGPVHARAMGLDGDEQYDYPRAHGGPQMAVLAYSADHYPLWRAELELPEMSFGGFGENLVIEGLDETTVCIGDVYEIGEVRLQVSSPRGPCSNISKRWKKPLLLKQVTANARTGWYHRVLREGALEAGQEVVRVERTLPEWTVERVFRARIEAAHDPVAVRALVDLPLLSPEWQEKFRERTERLGA